MKYALVEPNGRVAQVENRPFPVADPLRWIECGDEVMPDCYIFDGEFRKKDLRVAVKSPIDQLIEHPDFERLKEALSR